jgi:hypothetical protein
MEIAENTPLIPFKFIAPKPPHDGEPRASALIEIIDATVQPNIRYMSQSDCRLVALYLEEMAKIVKNRGRELRGGPSQPRHAPSPIRQRVPLLSPKQRKIAR